MARHFEATAELHRRLEAVHQLTLAPMSTVRAVTRMADMVRFVASVGWLRPAERRRALSGYTRHRDRAAVFAAICVLAAEANAQDPREDPTSAAFAAPAPAVQERCTEASIDVAVGSSGGRRLVCSAASRAIDRLGRCNITLKRPFRIQVLDEVRHPHHGGVIFGFYDIAREIVSVTSYDNIPDLVTGTPYSELQPLEFYKSLVFHEVVHVVMHQNQTHEPKARASYEYPAYALQIESLPPKERYAFLLAATGRRDPKEYNFSDLILMFDPFFFAARAYRHFKASPNRCAYLHLLLKGKAPFKQRPLLL